LSDRNPGPTFRVEEICFFDFETRSGEDLTKSGAVRYACDPNAAAIILAYAVGRGPVRVVTAPCPGEALVWQDLPRDFRGHGGLYAAFNAGFDRAIWNFALPDSPYLPPGGVIDPSVQATASGLPPDLKSACEATGSIHKVSDGDALIGLFCLADSIATPTSHPEEWQRFLNYAAGDVEAMRSLFLHTRQISRQEWHEYWAMEAINERGVSIDFEMAKAANTLSRETKVRGGVELHQLTGGFVSSVNAVAQLRDWLRATLPPDGIKILTKREEEEDEDGTVTRKGKYSLTRSRIEKLIPYCESIGNADAVRALNIRMYGGSTTPAKFDKILKQHVGNVLYGQYVFNGAPQTGRASSRGVQVHNLIRSALPYEHDAIEALLDNCDYDSFAALGDDIPVARKLALLIRPAFIPSSPLNVFVWSDWAQIEARILPWLVGQAPGATARLKIFRDVDADPSTPDIYVRAASAISNVPIDLVDEALRQRGKVAELALGFGGGVGALAAMGAAYGLYLPETEAKKVVQRWRAANPWCVKFWGSHTEDTSIGLWGAANRAMERPGKIQRTGRISYIYLKDYLNGSLLCRLPSGRFLTYRGIKYERVNDLDDDGNVVGSSIKLRFWKGRSRAVIWHGTLCENVVQAVAADVLRGTLARLENTDLPVRLHTHDEVVIEVEDNLSGVAATLLRDHMREGFDWTEGLPLMSEETVRPYYSKWKRPKAAKTS
jgi:DNA polymerase